MEQVDAGPLMAKGLDTFQVFQNKLTFSQQVNAKY